MAITALRSPLGYCSETDIENFLLTDINDTFSDQINNWISAAEDIVNRYTGYTTASGIWNEAITDEISESAKVDSYNNLVIFTRKKPIESLESIQLLQGSNYLNLNLTDSEGPKYQIPEPKSKIVYPEYEIGTNDATFSITSFRNIRYKQFFVKLSYHAGYTTVPGPINMATTMIASDYVLRHENKNGLQMIQQGRITKEYFQRKGGESDLVLDALALLNPYRKPSSWLIG